MGLVLAGRRGRSRAGARGLSLLLDTHFLLWVVLDSPRLDEFAWLDRYRPWGISPVSFLEIQFLAEVGRAQVRYPGFVEAVGNDPRFQVDEVPLVTLVRQAIPLGWTRDPFDRLLVGHSLARRVPFCTADRRIHGHHQLLPTEMKR